MYADIVIPKLPESVQFAEIVHIHVHVGQQVNTGDNLFDVETEKVIFEVAANQNGIIEEISVSNGDHVNTEQVVMRLRVNDMVNAVAHNTAVKYVENVVETLVKDDSGRVLLEEVLGNSLFKNRGIICGVLGLIVAIALGVLTTAVILG